MADSFPGFITVNDLPYADRVSIFSSGLGLHFRPGDRAGLYMRQIGIYPMPAAFLIADPQRMQSGFFYSMTGTEVGGCSEGPLGHPGDGEYDAWPVVAFKIAAKCTSKALTLGVSGTTGEGTSGFEHPEPLKPWKFHIEIRIPRDAIADALNLSEPEQRKLQETWSYFDAAA